MTKLSGTFVVALILKGGEAFAPRSIGGRFLSTDTSLSGRRQVSSFTKLNVGAEIEPEDLISLGQDCVITPEGFGFSSSIERVLKNARRMNGYYRAKASDSVTDVMEGITDGLLDVALVFDDESEKLIGIFTETDYIKVRTKQTFCQVMQTIRTFTKSFAGCSKVLDGEGKSIEYRRGIGKISCVCN